MKLITLLTDFSDRDGYVGVMKGVILGIAPLARFVDISHSIAPQDVRQAAWMLARSVPFFPPGTVHVAVVDPGVGTSRRGIIAQLGEQFFIGPDNGLITLLHQRCAGLGETIRMHELESDAYQLKPVSFSFHGRDVFAPAAAHFINGVDLEKFGGPISDPLLLDFPEPRRVADGWVGEIIQVDAFGNLAANIRALHLENKANTRIIIKNMEINGIRNTFGEGTPGELLAILDSFGSLSICVVNGSAATVLDAGVGETIRVAFLPI